MWLITSKQLNPNVEKYADKGFHFKRVQTLHLVKV